jgi:hypothetical protein
VMRRSFYRRCQLGPFADIGLTILPIEKQPLALRRTTV